MSKIDGRTIAANIEAVIRSVKREKKRRRLQKTNVENEPEVSSIADTLCARLKFITSSPLKDEPTDVMEDELAVVAATSTVNVLEEISSCNDQHGKVEKMDEAKTVKKGNAFEMMMNARNNVDKKSVKTKRKESLERIEVQNSIIIVEEAATEKDVTVKRKKGRPKKQLPILSDEIECNPTLDVSKDEENKTIIIEIKVDKKAVKRKATRNLDDDFVESKRAKIPDVVIEDVLMDSPSSRPRRNCARKSFSYLLNSDSPEKMPSPSPSKSICKSVGIKMVIAKDVEIIEVESSPVKSLLDANQQKARQNFLMSGMPEQFKIDRKKKLANEVATENELWLFPTQSHIPDYDTIFINPSNAFKFVEFNLDYNFDMSCSSIKLGEFTGSLLQNPIKYNWRQSPKASLINPKQLVNTLKIRFGNMFPVFRCYNQMNLKHRQFRLQAPKRKHHSRSKDDSIEIVEEKVLFPNGNVLFTEKYKPTALDHIIINMPPAVKLKEFLTPWLNDGSSEPPLDSSFADFDCSNDSTRSFRSQNNACVLLGPISSGKTMTVYALAQEFEFNVLEINAGSKRTGKKILADLQEATQSHQIKSKRMSDVFTSNSQPSSQQLKKSLILIEDADVIFEQDDGFISSLNVLVETSKRPVIFVANNENCPHLWKFIELKSIHFRSPSSLGFARYLSVMSITEGKYIETEPIQELYVSNKLDCRKTLLEFQFFVQSGGDRKPVEKHTNLVNFFTLDQNRDGLVASVNYNDITWDGDASRKEAKDDNSETDWESMTDFYETMSASICFHENGCDHIARDLLDRSSWKSSVRTGTKNRQISDYIRLSEVNPRNRGTEYDPVLRAICRHEKARNSSETRRFYHYLRTIIQSSNFNTKLLDSLGSQFEEEKSE